MDGAWGQTEGSSICGLAEVLRRYLTVCLGGFAPRLCSKDEKWCPRWESVPSPDPGLAEGTVIVSVASPKRIRTVYKGHMTSAADSWVDLLSPPPSAPFTPPTGIKTLHGQRMWTNVPSSWQKSWNHSQKCRQVFIFLFSGRETPVSCGFTPTFPTLSRAPPHRWRFSSWKLDLHPRFFELASPLHCKKKKHFCAPPRLKCLFTWPRPWTEPALKPLFLNQVKKHTITSSLSYWEQHLPMKCPH